MNNKKIQEALDSFIKGLTLLKECFNPDEQEVLKKYEVKPEPVKLSPPVFGGIQKPEKLEKPPEVKKATLISKDEEDEEPDEDELDFEAEDDEEESDDEEEDDEVEDDEEEVDEVEDDEEDEKPSLIQKPSAPAKEDDSFFGRFDKFRSKK